MDNRISNLGQGPGLAWKRNSSSFPPGSLAELEEWTGGKPPWHGEVDFQQWNTIGWGVNDDGVLCIRPWKGDTGETGHLTGTGRAPWYNQASKIKKIDSIGTIMLNSGCRSIFSYCGVTDLACLADWNASNVTNMTSMFERCPSLADLTSLEDWNVSKVTDMSYMFSYCRSLASLAGLENWNTSNVTIIRNMFSNCSSLTNLTPLARWNVSNVTDMIMMFYNCSNLTDMTAIKNWNVSNVTRMNSTFSNCFKIQKIGIPSIANGGQKLVENAKNASLTTVLPSIISEDGSMGPYTWDGLKSAMTNRPSAFQKGTVWVRANEEVAQ